MEHRKEHKKRMRGHPEFPTWKIQWAQAPGSLRVASDQFRDIIITSIDGQY